MKKHNNNDVDSQAIDRVEITKDTLTGRAGLSLFVRYLRNIKILVHLKRLFGSVKKHKKGLSVVDIFKQLMCFFVDGTSRHLTHFDRLRQDPGYAAAIETSPERMLSSHALKRFLRAFWWPRIFLFRRLLIKLFIWRLKLVKPQVIILGLDTTVLNNDDAMRRHGAKPTYKRVKGFQPLTLTWERFVVDAVFRSGSKHSNHGKSAIEMLKHVIIQIRKHYRWDVPILVRFDAGFFDQKFFRFLESMNIGYTGSGKLYDNIKGFVAGLDPNSWQTYHNDKQVWDFVEFGDRRGSWKRFRRAIFLKPRCDDNQQMLLEFSRPEMVLYTNLGMGGKTDDLIRKAGRSELLHLEEIIRLHHDRGSDELVHRATKEFASEKLPFKRFNQNAAYYYTMLLSFFLLGTFKDDVGREVVPEVAYPTTVRRRLIDFAAKIVRHAGKIILKVTLVTYEQLKLKKLWQLSGYPPEFTWA